MIENKRKAYLRNLHLMKKFGLLFDASMFVNRCTMKTRIRWKREEVEEKQEEKEEDGRSKLEEARMNHAKKRGRSRN